MTVSWDVTGPHFPVDANGDAKARRAPPNGDIRHRERLGMAVDQGISHAMIRP